MRIFFDANVLIDVATERKPFEPDSSKALLWALKNAEKTMIACHSVSNIYYALKKHHNNKEARNFLSDWLEWIKVVPFAETLASEALDYETSDYEDALQIACAKSVKADIIITRNGKHFKKSPIRAITPTEFLEEFTK